MLLGGYTYRFENIGVGTKIKYYSYYTVVALVVVFKIKLKIMIYKHFINNLKKIDLSK